MEGGGREGRTPRILSVEGREGRRGRGEGNWFRDCLDTVPPS